MLKIYVEVHTARIDGRIAIVRKEVPNNREAVLYLLKTLSEGFYYTNTKDPVNAMVLFEEPFHNSKDWAAGELSGWELTKAPVFINDFGEESVFCIRRHAEASQVKEGTFYI